MTWHTQHPVVAGGRVGVGARVTALEVEGVWRGGAPIYLFMLNRCSTIDFQHMPQHCIHSGGLPHCKCSLHIHHFRSALSLISSAGSGLCSILTNQLSLKLISWVAWFCFCLEHLLLNTCVIELWLGVLKKGFAIWIQQKHAFPKGFYQAVLIILHLHSLVHDLLMLFESLVIFLWFMILNCHILMIVFVHFYNKAVPAQFSQTLASLVCAVEGNLKVDCKLERNWIVVAQCTREISTFIITRSQGFLVLGHI